MKVPSLELVVPGDLQTISGGYAYDRRIISGLQQLGWHVNVRTLHGSFPHPTSAALEHARTTFASIREDALVLVDGLALGAMPQVLEEQRARLRIVALIHHPLAAEHGLAPDVVRSLRDSERQALRAARHVIVTSEATKRALQGYEVAEEQISVVEPGTVQPRVTIDARHARNVDSTVRMLCVATITPRKGHDVLIEALAPLTAFRWHLTCAGSVERCPATAAQLRAQIERLNLTERVTLAGEVDDSGLASLFRDADLFVLATRFEGYGMAVAEALAYGLPVISTATGAIDALVTGSAGILVRPGDVEPLRRAIEQVCEPARLQSFRAGAALARSALPSWSQACDRMSSVLLAVPR